MSNRLILTRGHAFGMGTFGQLTGPGIDCMTCERPWQGNAVGESCIPPGVYDLRLRESLVVQRTTRGDHRVGWQLQDVPGRTHIMIHPGNTIDDSEGCILPGRALGGWDVKGVFRWAVTDSRKTFDELMAALDGSDEWTLEVRYFLPEFP